MSPSLETAPSSRRSTRRGVGAAWWALLAMGLVLSVVLGALWKGLIERRDATDQAARATSVQNVVATQVDRQEDLLRSVAGMVQSQPHLTNAEFGAWYRLSEVGERYPGNLGIAYIEKVPVDRFEQFAAQQDLDPVEGIVADGPLVIANPAPDTAEYCLLRIGFSRVTEVTGAAAPPGIDLCASMLTASTPSPFPEGLAEASASNTPALVALDLLQPGLVAELLPVYDTAVAPDSPQAREQATVGWVIDLIGTESLVEPSLAGRSDMFVAVDHRSGDTTSRVASAGDPNRDHAKEVTLPASSDGTWSVTVSPGGGTASAGTVQGVTVFILGAIISGLVFALVRSIGGARDRAVAMVRETTEELAHQALHDELTGLPNRALLVDRAERMLARRARDGVGDVAALFVDLDNFKSVNDSLGHGAGDAYLRAVGLRLRSELRDADTVGRLGGDEFVVLVEGTTTIGGPPAVADRILHVLAEPIKINGVSLPVSCSVGIASGDHESAEALLDDADLAMYRAKLAGKGRYVVFEPSMRDSARDRLRLGWELREAIGGEGLLLAYRPLLDLRTGRPVGREAFVRWQHPTRGLLDSSTFASIAEECGLNVAMGQWTVREACRQGARRLAAGERARVVVKATDQQLFDDSFVDAIGEALIASDLPPDLLMIEVSENALIPEQEAARARLRGVKDLGVRIAVDDLGVGRASLRYLRHYPVDAVKLDHTLVAELVDSPESQAMVRTLVQVGETRDLEILAEANGAGAGLWELLFSPDASEPDGPDGSDQPPSRSPVVEQPVPHPIDPRTRPSPAAPEWTFEGR